MALASIAVFSPLPEDFTPLAPPPAHALLYSPSTQLPKNAEVALRRAVPVVNTSLREMQNSLEDIFPLLRIPQRKPYGTMTNDVQKAIKIATEKKDEILKMVPDGQRAEGERIFDQILTGKGGLEGLLNSIEEKDADRISIRLASSLNSISQLALLQAPGLPYLVSSQYANLPRLTGRAVAQMTILKADQSTFSIQNGAASVKTGVVEITLDGYSAPLTSGNFALLTSKRAYDGVALKVAASSFSVIADARDPSLGTELPLEVMPTQDFQPIYKTPIDIQDGELPVLPLSVFGATAMAHSPNSDTFSHPSQFFFYLYDKRSSGLGGIAFDEGQFSVFGYVTKGQDILAQLRTGDVIQSVRLISGQDRLVVPSAPRST